MSTKYYVYARFAGPDGKFHLKTKLYTYQLAPEIFSNPQIRIGSVVNITKMCNSLLDEEPYTPRYSTTNIRFEGFFAGDDFIGEQMYPKTIKILDLNFNNNTFTEDFLVSNGIKGKINHTGLEVSYRDNNNVFYNFDELVAKQKEEKRKELKEACSISKEDAEIFLSSDYISSDYYTNILKNTPSIITTNNFEGGSITVENQTLTLNEHIENVVEKFINKNKINDNKNNMEDNSMSKIFNSIFSDVDFGKLTTEKIKYSINGIAFADKSNKFSVYKDNRAIDVTGMTIEAPLFAIPVAVNQVQPNDVIRFKGDYVIVKQLVDDGVKVINPIDGDIKTIIPQVNIFGFNYMTKVINPFESFADTANETNPFGNMLPLMFLGDTEKNEVDDIFKYMMMTQMMGGNMNQMLPFMLLGQNKENNDFVTMMLMSQMCGGNASFNFCVPQPNKKEN